MIYKEVNACLENVEHIIFMGYSLPMDDLVWRSILLARKNNIKCSVVLGHGGPGHWQKGDKKEDIDTGGDERFQEELKRFFDLFQQPDSLRFYTKGIPAIFDDIEIEDLFTFS